MHRIHQWIENPIRFCPPNHNLEALIVDQEVFQKWEQIAGVSSDELDGWARIARMIGEHRLITLRLGAMEAYPMEIVAQSQEEVQRGVNWTPKGVTFEMRHNIF
jgi:hypothetical protein